MWCFESGTLTLRACVCWRGMGSVPWNRTWIWVCRTISCSLHVLSESVCNKNADWKLNKSMWGYINVLERCNGRDINQKRSTGTSLLHEVRKEKSNTRRRVCVWGGRSFNGIRKEPEKETNKTFELHRNKPKTSFSRKILPHPSTSSVASGRSPVSCSSVTLALGVSVASAGLESAMAPQLTQITKHSFIVSASTAQRFRATDQLCVAIVSQHQYFTESEKVGWLR